MGKLIGIDLGFTNTVVAIMDGPRARVLDSRESRPYSPSVVGLRRRRGMSGEIVLGDAAVDNWFLAPDDTIFSLKRLIGRSVADPEVQRVSERTQFNLVAPSNDTRESIRVLLDGKEHSPIDLSSLILRKAKEDAEYRLGEPVTHAVITVPAYFSQMQRNATRAAGLKAGLKVLQILDEPTAAAIAFGIDTSNGVPKIALVYDLGGGTFDVSLLMVMGDDFAPLRIDGDMWLGGDNIDQLLVDFVLAQIKEDLDIDGSTNRRFMIELRKASRAVKERLTSSRSAAIFVSGVLKDEDNSVVDVDIDITREQFERMILPLVAIYRECPAPCVQPNFIDSDRCTKCGKQLRFCRDNPCSCDRCVAAKDGRTIAIVRKLLIKARLDVGQVDCVLMAGSCTLIPLVQNAIEGMFGREKVVQAVHPKHCVALGAAIYAAWMGERVICPNDKCDQVNEPDATHCSKCDTRLQRDAPPEPSRCNERPERGRASIVLGMLVAAEPAATSRAAVRAHPPPLPIGSMACASLDDGEPNSSSMSMQHADREMAIDKTHSFTIVSPTGYRVEGLTLEQALTLLKCLGG